MTGFPGESPADVITRLLQKQNRADWARFAVNTYQLSRANQLLSELSRTLSTGLVMLSDGLWAVTSQLNVQTRMLERVAHAAENPRRASAGELVRRGARAAQHGWWPEAREALEEAVSLDPLDPDSLLMLGIARAQTGKLAKAATAWEKSARYGSGQPVGASAAMLGMAAYHKLEDTPALQRLSKSALRAFPLCAEVVLLAAVLTEDPDLTAHAVQIDPAAAFAAIALEAPQADDAAAAAASDPVGVAAALARARSMVAWMNWCAPGRVLEPYEDPDISSEDVPARLAAASRMLNDCGRWLPTARQTLAWLMEVRHYHPRSKPTAAEWPSIVERDYDIRQAMTEQGNAWHQALKRGPGVAARPWEKAQYASQVDYFNSYAAVAGLPIENLEAFRADIVRLINVTERIRPNPL